MYPNQPTNYKKFNTYKPKFQPVKKPFNTEQFKSEPKPISSYQLMLQLKAQQALGQEVSREPVKLKVQDYAKNKIKFQEAHKTASPFARRLLEKFIPKFLIQSG